MGCRIFRRWLINDLVKHRYRIRRLRYRIKIAYDTIPYIDDIPKNKM